MTGKHTASFTVKVREPYMGNQVPLTVNIIREDVTFNILSVNIVTAEGITHTCKRVDVQPMND